MNTKDIVKAIIKEQSLIIGETLAINSAKNSGTVGFTTNKLDSLTLLQEDSKNTIESIVNSYSRLFGQASVEVCINVVKKFPKEQVVGLVPDSIVKYL